MLKLLFLVFIVIHYTKCAPMDKEDGMDFLKKYGYMSNEISDDEDYKKSLQEFQETFSLPITGKLDSKTQEMMERPRCGRPDKQEIRNSYRIWNKRKITYKFVNFPLNGLSQQTAREELRKAFTTWGQQVPLQFEERPGGNVDIEIRFNREGDGPGKTLAYAYFPTNGDMYFDNEDWTVKSRNGFNLFTVAAHEMGHSLGLEHSMNKNALMYPYILPYNPNFRLHDDDVTRIQRLYGKRETPSTNMCNLNRINSIFYRNGFVYLIANGYVWKLGKGNKLQSGYPKRVAEKWKGAPSSINAIHNYGDRVYFHEGKNIYKMEGEMKKLNNDKKLVQDIDAAVSYGDRIYYFKGSNYYRLDNMQKMPGYPKTISSYWKNIPDSVDGVYYEDTYPYKYFYFFKGDKVYKFNMEDKEMMEEMPLRQYLSC